MAKAYLPQREPMLQPGCLEALLVCCGQRGSAKAIDTSGHVPDLASRRRTAI